MLVAHLKDKNLILASGSPRRKFFLEELGLKFEIRLKEVKDTWEEVDADQLPDNYLALLTAEPFEGELKKNDVLITADTIVWHENQAIGKPKDRNDAVNMLNKLSNSTHTVYSSVAITTDQTQRLINDKTKVKFKKLTHQEIEYYITNFKPFDKAGSYGIQEWLGYIGIENIEGSFFNVMGFPVQKFYEALLKI